MIVKGLKINYRSLGEGKPLLILHGWGSRSKNWQRVGEILLKNGIKVIIPDLPGFGESEEPREAWNLDDYCSFVGEFIKNLNLEKFYLLGHSFGGALAVKCSLKFPEKINKLFLVSAACIRRKTLKNKLFHLVSKIPFIPFRSFFQKIVYRKSDYLSLKGVMKETYLNIIKEDISGVLSQIQIPTNIIWGAKDKITSLKQARLINSKIKNSKLEILPGLGHDLNQEAPEKLGDRVSQELL